MKKIYLLAAAALLCSGMNAKTLTFYVGDTKVENGGTYTSTKCEENDSYKENCLDVTLDAQLAFEGDEDGVAVITTTCTSGQIIQFCVGGACEMGKSITKSDIAITAGKKEDGQLHWMDMEWPKADPIPTVEIEVTGFYAGDNANAVTFTIICQKEGAGVGTFGADSNSLSVSNGQVVLNGSSNVEVYSLDGRKVANENLAKGVYVAGGKKVFVK